jgi:hypothetical protein
MHFSLINVVLRIFMIPFHGSVFFISDQGRFAFLEAKRLSFVENFKKCFYLHTILRFSRPNQQNRKHIEFQKHCQNHYSSVQCSSTDLCYLGRNMREYMMPNHRSLIEALGNGPSIRHLPTCLSTYSSRILGPWLEDEAGYGVG